MTFSEVTRRHRPGLRPLNQGNISVGDLLHKLHVWVVEHDMEVLDRVDGLQGLPVLEPDDLSQTLISYIRTADKDRATNLLRRHPRTERLLYILIDLLPRPGCQVVGLRVVLELELDPHDQVDDALLNPVRPVVVQDLDVLCRAASSSV